MQLLVIQPRREIKRQNQEHCEDREVDANGRNPLQGAAVLVRGSILQYGFRKHIMQLLPAWRQDDMPSFHGRRISTAIEQNMLS
jgi:hypothetical protein